jgi:hypothetical protein
MPFMHEVGDGSHVLLICTLVTMINRCGAVEFCGDNLPRNAFTAYYSAVTFDLMFGMAKKLMLCNRSSSQ